jgi:hypothetical protein
VVYLVCKFPDLVLAPRNITVAHFQGGEYATKFDAARLRLLTVDGRNRGDCGNA